MLAISSPQPARPVHGQGLLALAQVERLQHAGQPEPVVGVEVGDEDVVEVGEADRAQELALGPFAAVEQQPLAAAAHEQRGQAASRARDRAAVPAKKSERSMSGYGHQRLGALALRGHANADRCERRAAERHLDPHMEPTAHGRAGTGAVVQEDALAPGSLADVERARVERAVIGLSEGGAVFVWRSAGGIAQRDHDRLVYREVGVRANPVPGNRCGRRPMDDAPPGSSNPPIATSAFGRAPGR